MNKKLTKFNLLSKIFRFIGDLCFVASLCSWVFFFFIWRFAELSEGVFVFANSGLYFLVLGFLFVILSTLIVSKFELNGN